MKDRLKDATEEADKERALKVVFEAMTKENDAVVKNAEEWTKVAERARALAEQKVVEMEIKLGVIEIKLAKAESINFENAKEIIKLKAALEANEDEWYNAGFADAKHLAEPVMYQSRRYGFSKGWMDALLAMGVSKDSPLRNLNQIPFLDPPLPAQNPTGVEVEENTPSMRDLVQEIDSHAKLIDLKITSGPNAVQSSAQHRFPDSIAQPAMDTTPAQPNQSQDPIT